MRALQLDFLPHRNKQDVGVNQTVISMGIQTENAGKEEPLDHVLPSCQLM